MKRLHTERRTFLCFQVVQLGEKVCRRSHTSHEVMDTRHTTEVNITKSSSCYTGIASPKPSKPSKIKDHLQALKRRIKLWDEGYIEGLFYKCMTIQ